MQRGSARMKPKADLLEPKQFAVETGVAVSTLNDWRARAYGPPYTKIGNRIFYDLADWADWLDSQKRLKPGAAG